MAPSVALPAGDVWAGRAEPTSGGFGLGEADRLSWPTSIAVITGLSAALWTGIAWLVGLAFG